MSFTVTHRHQQKGSRIRRLAFPLLLLGFALSAHARPLDIRSENLEPIRNGRPRPPILAPVGATNLLSLGCAVTSSTPAPLIGELSYITDGDKENETYASIPPGNNPLVKLGDGIQWVQVDLGATQHVYGVCVWRYHEFPQIYRDVIVKLSSDPDFIDGVTTVFNNDHDNSSYMGQGSDKEYLETNEGRPIPVPGIRARYVRVYSNGSHADGRIDPANHYTEIEVYGGTPTSEEKIPIRIELPKPTFM